MLFLRQVFLFIDNHFQRRNQLQSGFRRVDDVVDMEILAAPGLRIDTPRGTSRIFL